MEKRVCTKNAESCLKMRFRPQLLVLQSVVAYILDAGGARDESSRERRVDIISTTIHFPSFLPGCIGEVGVLRKPFHDPGQSVARIESEESS